MTITEERPMRLDWYDRRILEFVVECGPRAQPTDEQTLACFGISAQRVMRRLDAVIDVVGSHQLGLGENDEELVRRAAVTRAHAVALTATTCAQIAKGRCEA
jgi:hypothetical protein